MNWIRLEVVSLNGLQSLVGHMQKSLCSFPSSISSYCINVSISSIEQKIQQINFPSFDIYEQAFFNL